MATTFDHIKGKVIVHAQVTAQEGQADKVQALIKDIQSDVVSGKEPGCLTYRLSRSGNKFLVFEQYADTDAVKAHFELPKCQALVREVGTGNLTVGGPEITYYDEV